MREHEYLISSGQDTTYTSPTWTKAGVNTPLGYVGANDDKNAIEVFRGKKGIIAFWDFYEKRGVLRGHVDAWNGVSLRKGKLEYFNRSRFIWLIGMQ